MKEKLEKYITTLKQMSNQLPEFRDDFWLKIDRSNEVDKQRGIEFDNKFERIKEKYLQAESALSIFLENSFYDQKEEVIKILKQKHLDFDSWPDSAKNALIEEYLKKNEKTPSHRPRTQDKPPKGKSPFPQHKEEIIKLYEAGYIASEIQKKIGVIGRIDAYINNLQKNGELGYRKK